MEKEPTQRTQPAKGEPITIPVPTRGEIDDAIAKASRPLPAKSEGNVSEDRCTGTVHMFAVESPDAPFCDRVGGCTAPIPHSGPAYMAAHDTIVVHEEGSSIKDV
jgi:hypothetical protein